MRPTFQTSYYHSWSRSHYCQLKREQETVGVAQRGGIRELLFLVHHSAGHLGHSEHDSWQLHQMLGRHLEITI